MLGSSRVSAATWIPNSVSCWMLGRFQSKRVSATLLRAWCMTRTLVGSVGSWVSTVSSRLSRMVIISKRHQRQQKIYWIFRAPLAWWPRNRGILKEEMSSERKFLKNTCCQRDHKIKSQKWRKPNQANCHSASGICSILSSEHRKWSTYMHIFLTKTSRAAQNSCMCFQEPGLATDCLLSKPMRSSHLTFSKENTSKPLSTRISKKARMPTNRQICIWLKIVFWVWRSTASLAITSTWSTFRMPRPAQTPWRATLM